MPSTSVVCRDCRGVYPLAVLCPGWRCVECTAARVAAGNGPYSVYGPRGLVSTHLTLAAALVAADGAGPAVTVLAEVES
jgi:hypothetical protein